MVEVGHVGAGSKNGPNFFFLEFLTSFHMSYALKTRVILKLYSGMKNKKSNHFTSKIGKIQNWF